MAFVQSAVCVIAVVCACVCIWCGVGGGGLFPLERAQRRRLRGTSSFLCSVQANTANSSETDNDLVGDELCCTSKFQQTEMQVKTNMIDQELEKKKKTIQVE